ncbi:MAG: carboxypeptidase regulatory-like domain-containing protein, partial [Bacteroidota bacterium]
MLKKVLGLLTFFILIGGCLPKPEPRIGDFNAVVIDTLTKEPIPGVSVNIGDQPFKTDQKGQFSLADLAPGDYQIRMSREWYELKDVTYKHLGKPEPVIFNLMPASLSGRIYFSYDEGKNKEIYELLLESRNVRKVLSLQDSGETNPAWSRSERFAVESTIDKISKIKVYDFGNGNLTPILIQDGEHPSIDNEGKYVVFKSNGKIVKYDIGSNKEIESYDQAGWNPV